MSCEVHLAVSVLKILCSIIYSKHIFRDTWILLHVLYMLSLAGFSDIWILSPPLLSSPLLCFPLLCFPALAVFSTLSSRQALTFPLLAMLCSPNCWGMTISTTKPLMLICMLLLHRVLVGSTVLGCFTEEVLDTCSVSRWVYSQAVASVKQDWECVVAQSTGSSPWLSEEPL